MALRQRTLEPYLAAVGAPLAGCRRLGILGANASPVAMYDSRAYGLTRLLGMLWSPLVGEKRFTS